MRHVHPTGDTDTDRLPRTCGDEPQQYDRVLAAEKSAPHLRG